MEESQAMRYILAVIKVNGWPTFQRYISLWHTYWYQAAHALTATSTHGIQPRSGRRTPYVDRMTPASLSVPLSSAMWCP